jgi:hypothetical protein
VVAALMSPQQYAAPTQGDQRQHQLGLVHHGAGLARRLLAPSHSLLWRPHHVRQDRRMCPVPPRCRLHQCPLALHLKTRTASGLTGSIVRTLASAMRRQQKTSNSPRQAVIAVIWHCGHTAFVKTEAHVPSAAQVQAAPVPSRPASQNQDHIWPDWKHRENLSQRNAKTKTSNSPRQAVIAVIWHCQIRLTESCRTML